MGNAIYRLDGDDNLVRVRNIRRKASESTARVQNLSWKVDAVTCTFFDGFDDMGVIPVTQLLEWSGNGAIEAEVLIPSGAYGGVVATQGSDPYPNPYNIYKHGLSIAATNNYVLVNLAFDIYGATAYLVRHYIDTTSLGWFKIRGEYIRGTGGRLYVNDILVGTVGIPDYPLRYGQYSYIGRKPDLSWSEFQPFFGGYIKNVKYYNSTGELVLHYPLDDLDETGILREVINGVDADKVGAILSGVGGKSAAKRINI